MLENIDHITIGVRDHEDVLRILVTLNNTGDDLTVSQFENLVLNTLHSYRDVGINAHAYARQDADNFVMLDDYENPLSFEAEELPLLAPPRLLTKEVAYELGEMGVELSGFTQGELDKAVALSERKCLILWCIEDVYQQAEDDDIELNDEQAFWVLQRIKSDHDAGMGCNWDVISSLIGQVAAKVA
jgi:hypothetical protein